MEVFLGRTCYLRDRDWETKKVHEDDIYECMLDLHDMGKKITISKIAGLLNCSSRTVYRNMGNELKKEKELLNKEL